MADGQRVEIRVYKFATLTEDPDDTLDLYTDPCKHALTFMEASETQQVRHALQPDPHNVLQDSHVPRTDKPPQVQWTPGPLNDMSGL